MTISTELNSFFFVAIFKSCALIKYALMKVKGMFFAYA